MGRKAGQRKRLAAAVFAVAVGVALIVVGLVLRHDNSPSWTKPVPGPATDVKHTHGGSVRVVVDTPPEVSDMGRGGDTLRSLTQPRLFEPQPDGTWRASLVKAGSDRTSADGRSARFQLRSAKWTDGTDISVLDLRRTMDSRFADRVDAPDSKGVVHVFFKQKLPGWRMLWSAAGIAPPAPSISGGPFVVSSVTSGQQTVLSRNEKWFGGQSNLDEVRLQYVPDAVTARQLLQRGDVDVVAPRADSRRAQRFAADGVRTSTQPKGGTWMALQFNASIPERSRQSLLNAFPRDQFANTILRDQVNVFPVPAPIVPDSVPGTVVEMLIPAELPFNSAFADSFSEAVKSRGGAAQSRITDDAGVAAAITSGKFQGALTTQHDGPVVCWTCRYGVADGTLAASADAGDAKAQVELSDRAAGTGTLFPLWRERPFTAYRDANVAGVVANGYDNSAAWAASTWWKP